MAPFLHRISNRLLGGPVWWAALGGRLVAKRIPPTGPPVLLISLPRSGSSWVGETLAQAAGAMYLREPVTQTHLEVQPGRTVFELEPGATVPAPFREASARAFSGVPAFPAHVVPYPAQWRLRDRRRGCVLVKEVNPLALPYWLAEFAPRVIALIRHPAGVAVSLQRRGWAGRALQQWFSDSSLQLLGSAASDYGRTFWTQIGASQGLAHRLIRRQLRAWPDHLLVRYRDLCHDPVRRFRELYGFSGLPFDPGVESFILAGTEGRDEAADSYYGTRQHSVRMPDAWRETISDRQLAELRDAYLGAGGCYYPEDDW